jgi:hypothetical protein
MAWRLRTQDEELESDLIELQNLGITSLDEDGWKITKWEERQRALTGAERTHQWRERKRRAEYMGDGTKAETFRDGK